ncbi:MAG TPA: hypothetical protein VH165_24740 [Kofleriaceae bacterium]|jgi:hypothetical protein|nr:hypothetical protein [Kofleriaceae bacterium]
MICERYWRDGVLQVERGERDPHRETCGACQHAHQRRDELVAALSLIDRAVTGDPVWQARVWSRIARLEARPPRRWWQVLTGGLVAAATLMLVWWQLGAGGAPGELRPHVDIVPSETVMRSMGPRVGDRIRVAVRPADEVRIYRSDQLVLRCPASSTARTVAGGCTIDDRGMVVDSIMAAVGNYDVVIITAMPVEPLGNLARDLGAVVSAGGEYQLTSIAIE